MKLTCPTENRLREFLEGAVSNTEADQISDHVDSCSSCDLVISKLESNQDHVLDLKQAFRDLILSDRGLLFSAQL